MIFDAVVIVCCIYGLIQSNNVFVGFATFDCSILKFIDEVSDGETKSELPKWHGFIGIVKLLEDIINTIQNFGSNFGSDLSDQQSIVNDNLSKLEKIITTTAPSTADRLIRYNVNKLGGGTGNFWLKSIMAFGDGNDKGGITMSEQLKNLYSNLTETCDNIAESSKQNLNTIKNEYSSIENFIEMTKEMLNDLMSPIDDVKNLASDFINKYFDIIDNYGKKAFKAIFIILTIIDAATATLLIIYFIFGTTICVKKKTFKCLNKCFIHILWNILALLMIFTFLIGAIFTLVGTLGDDLVSVIIYLIKPINLSKGENAILFGDASRYINVCANGNGDLAEELGLTTGIGVSSFVILQTLLIPLDLVGEGFKAIKNINLIDDCSLGLRKTFFQSVRNDKK